MQKYQSTIFVSAADFKTMKPGQWVQTESGARGQFMGVTQSGVTVVRWQPTASKFGAKRDTRNNATLRKYAKDYGAK